MSEAILEQGSAGPIAADLAVRFPGAVAPVREARGGLEALWVDRGRFRDVLRYLKEEARPAWPLLFDLWGTDERTRAAPPHGAPACAFSATYELLCPESAAAVRLRVALPEAEPALPTITDLWPNAAWYEREAWDMLGFRFEGHERLKRILLPEWWEGHPLRKEHPTRRTEMRPYRPAETPAQAEGERLAFDLADLPRAGEPGMDDLMVLNLGPHHPGTHGLVRFVLRLDGEHIEDCAVEIGYHHRAQEKIAERQSWHTYGPYPDRLDYLSGVNNELPYFLAVERLAGIEPPPRATAIRVLLCELFRIASHLVYLGTYAGDLGAQTPIFSAFTDRERVYRVTEAITGYRMHPAFLRIGGVSMDLPKGWEKRLEELVAWLLPRLDAFETGFLDNHIVRGRTVGVGEMSAESMIAAGMTGPNLRAAGFAWDLRKRHPYCGYEALSFDVVVGERSDVWTRAWVRVQEVRESLKMAREIARALPEGPIRSDHPLAMPPRKADGTLLAIETLIHHFQSVGWGKPLPVGEAAACVEAPKGNLACTVASDGSVHAYRLRWRTPSFPLLQAMGARARGMLVSDFVATLGSVDYVMGDVDR